MAIPPKKFREVVFQLLFSQDIAGSDSENIIPLLMSELSTTKKTVKEAASKVAEILNNKSKIDEIIRKTSLSYNFERIQAVERNILRLALYEMFDDEEIPPKVAIAEAMRLAKKFGTPESATFVNAILDAIYQKSLGNDSDQALIEHSSSQLEKSEEAASQALLLKENEPDDDQADENNAS